ncbi:hypothetical protein NQ318_014896, partial [Aromia moschata]
LPAYWTSPAHTGIFVQLNRLLRRQAPAMDPPDDLFSKERLRSEGRKIRRTACREYRGTPPLAVAGAGGNAVSARDFDLFPELPVGIVETKNFVCREHSRMYVEHLKNLSLWAYEMRDSTAKSVTGLLRGSISNFGQFEECLTAKSPFPTQYCLPVISANVPEPDPPRDPKSLHYDPNELVLRKIYDHKDPSQQPENVVLMGWCVPASCTPNDLQNYLDNYLESVDFP